MRVACTLFFTLPFVSCKPASSPPQSVVPESGADESPADLPAWFEEVTATSGIDVVHQPGDPSRYAMPQIMGVGGAVVDYDCDGRLDVLLIDAASKGQTPPRCRIWRQTAPFVFCPALMLPGDGSEALGMGATVGDVNDDGFPDVYLTVAGRDQLWLNEGDGTFSEVTGATGIESPAWGTAAAFCDFDSDGHLDLFVVNYVQDRPGEICEDAAGAREFCGPSAFEGTVDRIFYGRGEQSPSGAPLFEDRTLTSGIAARQGKGLGIACLDLTGDGLMDVYVANDMEANFLWVQQPGGTFVDEAVLRGAALSGMGEAEASMGVAATDLNGDGQLELLMTHLRGQTNTIYQLSDAGSFTDVTPSSGMSAPSLRYTGFGITTADFDLDGDIDVAIANGRVKRTSRDVSSGRSIFSNYAEANQLFENTGNGSIRERTATADPFTRESDVSRGLAAGDIDNDGAIDLLLTNCGGPARLYRNRAPRLGNWLQIRLVDGVGHRDALGAQVTLELDDGSGLVRHGLRTTGYLTSSDSRLHFGAPVTRFAALEVRWPDGTVERFSAGAMNRQLTLVRGGQSYEIPQGDQTP